VATLLEVVEERLPHADGGPLHLAFRHDGSSVL
jgi:hypothetical protein